MRTGAIVAVLAVGAAVLAGAGAAYAQERPNILWLSSEDNGPALGAYGDAYADTPNLDRLAERGAVYLNAWSNAPVCAPARTAIITGMYPPATGSHHMRSQVRLPEGVRMFPQLLREAGYYTTNNAKEDYNVEKPGRVWDESSNQAHWRNRPGHGGAGAAPFFAVFNLGITHESLIRQRPHEAVHDPAGVRVPAYHPDVPEVRQDWAQYYDRLTEMDAQVGERLAELEAAGLAGDTIVVYFGDHGVGLPRGKRSLLNSGLQVPLIVYVPPRFRELAGDGYRPGASTGELAAFVDLAPTMLSLAGIPPSDHMHGRALLGPYRGPPADYLYGFRDRMDERYDFVRGVRDDQYLYVRSTPRIASTDSSWRTCSRRRPPASGRRSTTRDGSRRRSAASGRPSRRRSCTTCGPIRTRWTTLLPIPGTRRPWRGCAACCATICSPRATSDSCRNRSCMPAPAAGRRTTSGRTTPGIRSRRSS